MIVVSDTSAISNLWQIGALSLLEKLFVVVVIPPAVQKELMAVEEQQQLFVEEE